MGEVVQMPNQRIKCVTIAPGGSKRRWDVVLVERFPGKDRCTHVAEAVNQAWAEYIAKLIAMQGDLPFRREHVE
ncbi:MULTISPECIES: hypothetical protein [Roseobacteraceae]|uniref:hypothetical protein n=1 Tax=Roseobacteraceae TaxID=2854170 RepID=UPI0031CF1530